MEQQEALIRLEAARTWRAERGPLEHYANASVRRGLSSWAYRQRCVVRGALPAFVDVEAQEDGLGQWCALVRAMLARELRDEPLALEVYLEGRPPRDVAAMRGVPVGEVYAATQRARRVLRASHCARRLRDMLDSLSKGG